MTDDQSRTLPLLPAACTLSASDGAARLEAWRAFDADYLLGTDDLGREYIARYAKVPDAEERLARLVERESTCCSFATWSIERTEHHLRLLVSGTPDALSALSIR
ncbi:hypothetical protein [Amnibacterium kyonggiense]|uniref:Uncharacterized protein n=1 Tax=Amnibacterium kyonggiense TaxID=595671 RepID=A0A4R7FRC7_9MICO|nr:hypothetical protein [Amnibacterium kyonggiense]TDS80361.1 hypothetical protein CLV52_0919 [Amnibacterium kyonggiense]